MPEECNTTSVRALILRDYEMLVEYLAPLSISFCPGGQSQEGEDLRQTLDRELREELTNCDFEIGRYLGKIACFWSRDGKTDSCLNHFFEVALKPAANPKEIRAAEPGREFRWINLRMSEAKNITPGILLNLIERRLQGDIGEWDLLDRQG